MANRKTTKKGKVFPFKKVIIVPVTVLIICIAGFATYYFASKINNVVEVPKAPEITDQADLTKAITTMDSIDLDAAEEQISKLELELDKF
jgi:hypothetical protein